MITRLRNLKLYTWLVENPVILKEMRSRMRGWRSFLSLTAFITILGGIVGMIYLTFAAASSISPGINARKEFGQALFYTIYSMELFAVCAMSASVTSGAIATEREQQTYELLRTTLLSARSLVLGKLLAALSFVLLVLFASLPIQSIGFMFGGVTTTELILGTIILLVTAVTFGSLGLFFSSFIRRARIATVLSQAIAMILTVGVPIFALTSFGIVQVQIYSNPLNPVSEIILFVIGALIVISSPIAAAVTTETVLLDNQSWLFYQTNVGGANLWLPSPWIGFIILYSLLAVLLLAITIRIVQRPERE